MGKLDIHVIPIPRKELLVWWGKMTKDNKAYVKERPGVFVQAHQPRVPSELNSSIISFLGSYHLHISIGQAQDGTYTRKI